MKKQISRWAAMLLSLAMLLVACAVPAFAYERVDTDADTSLTAYFTENGTGIEGASFSLYRVADVSDAVQFDLSDAFAGASVSLDDIESAGTWSDMALTLSAYADANSISPVKTGTTNADGKIDFSGLTVGLYLLTGDPVVIGDYSYAPAPSMILLPTLQEDDSWNYTPSVDVKYTKSFIAATQDVSVKKVWSDGNYDKRPGSVTIQLLQDGTVQDTVTLNADNNWTYTWKDLTSTYEGKDGAKQTYRYTVNEVNVAAGYTVAVSQNDTSYTVTNTREAVVKAPDKKLPQTGMLNWPIPILVISGLLLVGAGWCISNRTKEN